MNCQEFDQIVGELASPRAMNTAVRESGLTHSATCQNCAVRLANARALNVGLKALASTNETSEASTHTEAILLAAFRQHQELAASSAQQNVAILPARKNWMPHLPIWAYAAAAAVLIGIIAYASSIWQSARHAPQEVAVTPSPKILALPVAQTDGLMSVKQNEKSKTKRVNNHEQPKPIDDGSSVQVTLGEMIPIYREEVATDFLPLTHEADPQPMDSGQVIRVQVPRTALASFGLPINIERANEPVKADLLLAEDGSARAIRFIR
ncbi:MAG: hypothetical protein JST85_12645 [Acidobacteria bacterium]|nr:hypothetical protein [Acidobacteriota bacterium]